MILVTGIKAQESGNEKISRRFHIGINYTYFQTGLKLKHRTEHAVWQGLDYGVDTLTNEEIDWINSAVGFESRSNAICLEAGLTLLGRPGIPWHIDANILLGVAQTWYTSTDKRSGSADLHVSSGYNRPCLGLEFLFLYSFNPHWDLALDPMITYSWGSTDQITDNLDLPVPTLEDIRKERSGSLYSRVTLMAGYRIKGFRVSAGPGFYLICNHREYNIDRTNPENGSTFNNQSISDYSGTSFIDGSVRLEWRIIPLLEVFVSGGIGNDYYIHPGVRFFL